MLGIALVFSAAGAYDTDELGVAHRFILWLTVSSLIVGQAFVFHIWFSRLRWFHKKHALAAGAAVFVTLILVALELHGLKYTPLLPKEPDPIFGFIIFLSPTVVPIAGAVVTARIFLSARRVQQSGDPIDMKDTAAGPITDEWPHSPVSTVKSTDHYLEVNCDGAVSFVRGRMKDAVSHLADADGLQVHRSWWVARGSVDRVETRGRDKVIVLHDGRQIPVARSRVQALRDRRWM